MKRLFKSILSVFVFSILFLSCDKEEEPIPSYLHIKAFTLIANPPVTGLGTYEIPSAKVFVNGNEIGNFELPVTIPVLTEGRSYIQIFPNIKENGVGANQKYFSPYVAHLDTLVLSRGQIDTTSPVTSYRTNTQFAWLEDFEDQAISMIESGNDNTSDSIIVIPSSTFGVNQPFTGSQYCGFVNLGSNTSDKIFERSSLLHFSVPNLGADVYLEMDIKANQQMQVGIYADNGIEIIQTPVMITNETKGEWRKIYVNLKPETGSLTTGTRIKIFFGMYKSAEVLEDQYLYIDNIKLLYL